MTIYYKKQLEIGSIYQDAIMYQLYKQGIIISCFCSKYAQLNIGESINGYEIKYSKSFNEMNSIWIETHERQNINQPYTQSGLLRKDNTRKYITGDTQSFIILNKKIVQSVINKKIETGNIRENKHSTSKGFTLSMTDKYYNLCLEDAFTVDNETKNLFFNNEYFK